ncbi:MAG: hypothetical protein MZU97_21355 [Bacillus subtilis]|nr:hypothetical protein [Bacillus subtilis]
MNVLINPKPLTGTVAIPPSKSLSHRAIIAASLCQAANPFSTTSSYRTMFSRRSTSWKKSASRSFAIPINW